VSCQPVEFYRSVIAAGAIMTGFCGTFLSFRIQREANYFRQPAISFDEGKARDIYIGLTHFTSSFLLLILASLCSMVFGFLFPLLALIGAACTLVTPNVIAGGLIATLVLLAFYFFDELLHYQIVGESLAQDAREWGREVPLVIVALVLAAAAYFAIVILS
jgi:hypothetical protein